MGVSLLMLIPTQHIEADWELITVRVGGQAVSVAILCHLRLMFVCYSITLGMLGLAYQSPDLFVVVLLLLFARTALRSH